MARNRPVEISIENDERNDESGFIVRFGDRLIDTTYIEGHINELKLLNPWIREIHQIHKIGGRGTGGPLVAGLSFFPTRRDRWSTKTKGPASAAANPGHPICMVAICVGGSHCLLFQQWHSNRAPYALREFLADRRFSFIGVRMERDAAKLEKEWNVHVTNRTELAPLVERAFGVKLPPVKGCGAGLEEMARVVLGGMNVKSKPARMADCDWYLTYDFRDDRWGTSYEHIMYACVDAFLAFEIGSKCLDRINNGGRIS